MVDETTELPGEFTRQPRGTILLIGSESSACAHVLQPVADTMTARPADVPALLAAYDIDVIVLDDFGEQAAMQGLLAETLRMRSGVVPIVISAAEAAPGWSESGVAVVAKPVAPHALRALCTLAVRSARSSRAALHLTDENRRLRGHGTANVTTSLDDLGPFERYQGLLSHSPAMAPVLAVLRRLESTDAPLVIRGESGTGKELIAEAIHTRSRRRAARFVTVHLGGLGDTQREDELFGQLGTTSTARPGRLAAADRGTLFLDEVGDASPSLQAALLRVLEDGTVTPPGTEHARRVDVRVIAGTQRSLEDMVRQGLFRRDLYERLHAARIDVPPLRERVEDIFLLARHFLAQASLEMGRRAPGISREARAMLEAHAWPGNVRELRNVMERAAMLCKSGLVIAADLPVAVGWSRTAAPTAEAATGMAIPIPPGGASLKQLEREIFVRTLALAGGNQSRAAQILGLCESTFRFRLHKLGIAPRRTSPRGTPPAQTSQLVARG